MIRGLYIAGTGMLTQRNKMDVITNNLTNADTIGFREESMLSRTFEDMLLDRENDPAVLRQDRQVGPLSTGTHIDEINISFGQGAPEETGLTTDMAIEGDGFFVVNTPAGDRYTRAGNFTLDAQGVLRDVLGNPVQGENGNITLTSDHFVVRSDGTIFDEVTGNQVARLRIVEFTNEDNLREQAGNLFYVYQDAGMRDAENSAVLQGYIESSNVNIANQMVSMIIASRAYETSQRVAGMIDQTLDAAVNDIARF
ncbi:MAG: flagellar basal-body rod protein FlgF [Eubacteriales bacterium]|nr:flagellar basal-body rod protein FlgF [Eubacteriales bacterium]